MAREATVGRRRRRSGWIIDHYGANSVRTRCIGVGMNTFDLGDESHLVICLNAAVFVLLDTALL
jgi:hypothetical protein